MLLMTFLKYKKAHAGTQLKRRNVIHSDKNKYELHKCTSMIHSKREYT